MNNKKQNNPQPPSIGYIQKQIDLQTPMVFELYDHCQYPAIILENKPYELILKGETDSKEIRKIDIKYCYKAEAMADIHSLRSYNEDIKVQGLKPIIPRKERYKITSTKIKRAQKAFRPVQATMREGEVFQGWVQWYSRYEIKLILENMSKMMVFRHAICDFLVYPVSLRW